MMTNKREPSVVIATEMFQYELYQKAARIFSAHNMLLSSTTQMKRCGVHLYCFSEQLDYERQHSMNILQKEAQ